MKHRHSGPAVRYRTSKGRISYRKRPSHPVTIKKESRRGSRNFLGFGERKRKDEYTPEELDYLRDTYNSEPEEIEESEAEQTIEEFREEKEDEKILSKISKRGVRRKRHTPEEMEDRIRIIMEDFGYSREDAKNYIHDVEE